MPVPQSYNWPLPKPFLDAPQRYLDAAWRELAREINRPLYRLEGQATVPAGNMSITIPVLIDRFPYYITATPSWNTTVWIDPGRTLTSFTLNFGTAAPAGDGVVDWQAVQPECGP